LFNNHVGLAEHPDIIETLDSQLGLLADYDEKLEMLYKHFYRQKVDTAGPPDNTG
jgi:Zn-finger domain-containing protein